MAKSTKVVANLSVATAAAYQEGALRTKSDSYFGQHQSRNVLRGYLSFIISNNNELDHIKKAMFYGRGLGEHTPVYAKESSVHTDDAQVRDLIHSIIGINTEGGELAERLDAILARKEESALSGENMTSIISDEDKVNLFEELGDVLWYIAIGAEALGVTLDQIMFANLDKLKKRFPEKFTEAAANNRDIEAEQNNLENNLTQSADWGKVEEQTK
ncbi:putative pyrophosphatase [Acinetobacter phage vB_AbaS_D0]|nr:putative pyrophosphatase [Acinetobacter phage vB_AbaS_D0]